MDFPVLLIILVELIFECVRNATRLPLFRRFRAVLRLSIVGCLPGVRLKVVIGRVDVTTVFHTSLELCFIYLPFDLISTVDKTNN
eukprot:8222-Amphidinium_carterae.2